jgi:hypothetical protein
MTQLDYVSPGGWRRGAAFIWATMVQGMVELLNTAALVYMFNAQF